MGCGVYNSHKTDRAPLCIVWCDSQPSNLYARKITYNSNICTPSIGENNCSRIISFAFNPWQASTLNRLLHSAALQYYEWHIGMVFFSYLVMSISRGMQHSRARRRSNIFVMAGKRRKNCFILYYLCCTAMNEPIQLCTRVGCACCCNTYHKHKLHVSAQANKPASASLLCCQLNCTVTCHNHTFY